MDLTPFTRRIVGHHSSCFLFNHLLPLLPLLGLETWMSFKIYPFQIPTPSAEEALPRSARCVFSCLCCIGHSCFLHYLKRINRAHSSSCCACGHQTQDLIHLLVDCPVYDYRIADEPSSSLFLPFLTYGPGRRRFPE